MSDYLRIGEVAQAVGVSVDTLRRWERDGRIRFQRHHNQRVLPAADLPALVASASAAARTGTASSARNRLRGTVVRVQRDRVMASVEMSCGDFRVVSLMSRESADELGLKPGVSATAVIKATNVVVET